MAVRKPVFTVPGGYQQVATTDQIAVDAGAMTVTPTDGAAGALTDKIAERAPKANPSFSGSVIIDPGSSSNAPTNINLIPTSHSSGSKRASLGLGDWGIGQDFDATGVKDLYIYNGLLSSNTLPLRLSTLGVFSFPAPPIITSANVDQFGNSNVSYAGADASGSSDSTSAFQVSLDKIASRGTRGGSLVIPAGTYRCGNLSYSTANAPLSIIGSPRGQAAIVQTGGALFQVSGGGRFEMRNLFALNTSAGGAFLSLDTPAEYVIANVRGYPTTTSSYWDTALNITNPLLGSIQDIYMQNIPPGTNAAGNINFLRGNGFGANATKISVNNSFHNVYFSGFYYGINHSTTAQPGCEGFLFTNCVMEGVRIGVHTKNTAYNAPQPVSWIGGHVNAFERCFLLEGCSDPQISNALLYRDVSYNIQGGHIFVTGGGGSVVSSGCMVTNNQLRVINNDASHDAGGVSSIHFDGGSGHAALNNNFLLSSGFTYSVFTNAASSRAMFNEASGSGLSGTGVTITGANGYSIGNRANFGTPG